MTRPPPPNKISDPESRLQFWTLKYAFILVLIGLQIVCESNTITEQAQHIDKQDGGQRMQVNLFSHSELKIIHKI